MEGHDYDNRAAVPGWNDYFTDWRHRSKVIRARAGATLDISYGAHPRERVDWFAAGAPALTLVFVHGGYWQWGNKKEFAFLAEPWLDTGVAVAMLGYPLAPAATVPEIMESVRRGIAFVTDKSEGELVVMGWSAGAQLAVQACAATAKVIGLSGIYDLRPLLVTPINDALKMNAEMAIRCSPALKPPQVNCLVGVGADERPELRQQTEGYFDAVQAKRVPAVLHEWPGLNHYSILDACAAEDSAVFKDIQRFISS